jgi:hypothetical protein
LGAATRLASNVGKARGVDRVSPTSTCWAADSAAPSAKTSGAIINFSPNRDLLVILPLKT